MTTIIINMITKIIALSSRMAIQAVQWWALWVISLSPPPSLGSSPVVSRHFRYNDDNNHEIGAFISRLSHCCDDDESCQSGIFYQHIYLQFVSKTNYVDNPFRPR